MNGDEKRVIESEVFTVKLLNGSSITIRPLTLKERSECLKFASSLNIPTDADNDTDFASQYLKWQGDLVHYIITRSIPTFKREDVDSLLDTKMLSKIVELTLKDPFANIFIMR